MKTWINHIFFDKGSFYYLANVARKVSKIRVNWSYHEFKGHILLTKDENVKIIACY